jgi:hypothetical protein
MDIHQANAIGKTFAEIKKKQAELEERIKKLEMASKKKPKDAK